MALGTGISFLDWIQQTSINDEISMVLNDGTEVISIDNLATERPREIARITPKAPFGGFVSVKLTITASANQNGVDGKIGMTMGCISIINHNIPFDHPFRFKILLKDYSDLTLYSATTTNRTLDFEGANYHYLFDQVYDDIKTAEITLEIAYDGTYQFDVDLDLGRLWAGNWLEAEYGPEYGFSHPSGGGESLSIGNDSHLNKKRPRQRSTFNFAAIHEDQIIYDDENWHNLSRKISTDSEILLLPRIDDDIVMQKLGIYGKLKRPATVDHENGPYWFASLDVIELV